MHDLIQAMGREIARQAAPREPGKRSRLWCQEDVFQVLSKNSGTDNIEGIILETLPQGIQWIDSASKKMRNLKMFVDENAIFSFGPKYLPNISIKQPKPFKELECLDVVDLSYCQSVNKLPDMSGAPRLRKLNLAYCLNLIEPPDLSGVPQLRELNLAHSEKLIELPDLSGVPLLRQLNLARRKIQVASLGRSRISFREGLECFLGCDPLEQLMRKHKAGDKSRTMKRDESIQRQLTELVGIDERCEHIELLLEKFSIVGIWGMSGIGKTTIAKVVFTKFFTQFERCCFIENVGEEYMKHGLNYLRDKLLSELFKEENPNICRPILPGSTQLLKSLGSEKVLIVLDDVDDLNQLEHLTKECNYLGAGSRVIITTRYKNLLASARVDKIYEVKELNLQESLQLFWLNAFNQNFPKIGYEEQSIKVVVHCKGILLALKVLGSFLRSKTIGEWESVLAELAKVPDDDIQHVLRFSYDGLEADHKEIFLEIARFLKGEDKDHVVRLLESHDFNASVGMATLLDTALITISDDNRVWMHDLIQDMGQKIIERCLRESHRLCQNHALLNGKWTRTVEGLQLDVSQINDLHLCANNFKRMSGRKLLTFDSTGVEKLPSVYHCHDRCRLKLLPSKFLLENLVDLCIQNTDDEKLFDIGQGLLNLRTSGQLIELPDLSKVPSESESFDDGTEEGEPKWRDTLIEKDIFDFGSSFQTMKVTDESQLKELPPNLRSLRVVGCYLLESLPDELMNKTSNVSELYAIDCPSLKNLVGRGIFTSLRTLYVHKCRKLEFLLYSENFAFLEHLCVGSSCDSLKFFTMNHFPKLKTLCIWNCPNLESLLISEEFEHGDLPLESLEIRDCHGLISFPTKGLLTPNLKSLTLSNCIALRSLPNHMASLKSLRTIFIGRCPHVDSLPEGGLPCSLCLLSIASCDKLLPQKEWELNRLHSLNRFEIECGCVGMESFPEKDLLPSNLNCFRISKLPSLSVLDYEGLQQLTDLRSLDINCCYKLSSIPDEGLPPSLISLSVKESPLLTQNLMHKLSADWCKIAHIPIVRIDEDFISSHSE